MLLYLGAHRNTLAAIAITTGTEHAPEPAAAMSPQ
jgi:hypothetical protein